MPTIYARSTKELSLSSTRGSTSEKNYAALLEPGLTDDIKRQGDAVESEDPQLPNTYDSWLVAGLVGVALFAVFVFLRVMMP